MKIELHQDDCLAVLKRLEENSIDLVYLDPPFYTQKVQRLTTRDRSREFKFSDLWDSYSEYAEFLHVRLVEMWRVLASTGSVFFHCDRHASHLIRALLDDVFGANMFRSDIVWNYRRWSNSQRTLLPSHQTIYFYSKSEHYKFNTIYQEYSPATNVDQILQKRVRDKFGKAIYARDDEGNTMPNGSKKGVPLGDVWDIPFLNPKARERTGYPTQKPIMLLERIIELTTDRGDWVLDPFCGSGTTVVTANILERNAIGIDTSEEALSITRNRLDNPIRSQSDLLEKGREAYDNADKQALAFLQGLDFVPVHRNKGIDAILKEQVNNCPVLIRVQRHNETIFEAANALYRAGRKKNAAIMFLVECYQSLDLGLISTLPPEIIVIPSPGLSIYEEIRRRTQSNIDITHNEDKVKEMPPIRPR